MNLNSSLIQSKSKIDFSLPASSLPSATLIIMDFLDGNDEGGI